MAEYLPAAFQKEMASLFADFAMQDQFADFLASFDQPSARALRANQSKISPGNLRQLLARSCKLAEDDLRQVPWAEDGLYLPAGLQPAKLPYYPAGLYYIQEPSAMLPAQVLAVRPGETVLDICAAPGGKAGRLSADLAGQGLLWANDISVRRARALKHNLELAGSKNALVTHYAPEDLASCLEGAFDAILADVPCSAAGMFRRVPATVRNWQEHNKDYPEIQKQILLAAWRMLKPGGRLVYSTCTFSLAENELMIEWFSQKHPDCQILPINEYPGVTRGLPVSKDLAHTARIWPHRSRGDGHFCALLQKTGESKGGLATIAVGQETTGPAWSAFRVFCQNTLSSRGQARVRQLYDVSSRLEKNGHLFLLPPYGLPPELTYLMQGLYLGQVRQQGRSQRFLPAFSFLLSLACPDLARPVPAGAQSDLIRRCLKGESLVLPAELAARQWPAGAHLAVVISEACGCWPLSWARLADKSVMKNDLPRHML